MDVLWIQQVKWDDLGCLGSCGVSNLYGKKHTKTSRFEGNNHSMSCVVCHSPFSANDFHLPETMDLPTKQNYEGFWWVSLNLLNLNCQNSMKNKQKTISSGNNSIGLVHLFISFHCFLAVFSPQLIHLDQEELHENHLKTQGSWTY